MKYRDFVENFLDIAESYIEEVRPEKPIFGISITRTSRSIDVVIEPRSEELYGVGKTFHNGRGMVIRALRLVKHLIEDPVLGRTLDLQVSDEDLGYFHVHFEVTKDGRIKIDFKVSRRFFDSSSVEDCLNFFEEADKKISEFENLMSDLKDTINPAGYFLRRYDKENFSKLPEVVEYLTEVKRRAIKAGLNVKEKIYLKKKSKEEFERSKNLGGTALEASWKIIGSDLEIYLEFVLNYLDQSTAERLMSSDKLTLENLASVLKGETKT